MRLILVLACLVGTGVVLPVPAHADRASGSARAVPVQMQFEAPPKPEGTADVTVLPSSKALDAEELKRAEALLPLLEGKQELWAMGEFVHLGPPVVPILIQALKMPGSRTRYNAIETLSMIKEPGAVPALLESVKEPNEMPRIREHALRVAVRLDPSQVPPVIEFVAKDSNPTLRKTAAFEARYVRYKAVIPTLIGLVADDERFVAITAVHSLWLLTRHQTELHDWETSTKQDRTDWAQEWIDWWNANQQTFELPEPRQPRKPL